MNMTQRIWLTASLTLIIILVTGPASSAWLAHEDAANNINIRVWANEGTDKVTKEELRAFQLPSGATNNLAWDGETIKVFGAKNEVISFSVIVENNSSDLNGVAVEFDRLTSSGFTLETTNHSTEAMFDWRERPIEVFVVDYLRILGLSVGGYDQYDERHMPTALQRPHTPPPAGLAAQGIGVWEDRPNHNRSYPDIAIPHELVTEVSVDAANSQQFWVDVYLPKETPEGILNGTVKLNIAQSTVLEIPVQVEVLPFTLPDERHSKTMLYTEARNLKERYFTGVDQALAPEDEQAFRDMVNRHYALAWRHGISMVDNNQLLPESSGRPDQPNIDWQTRLAGEAYTEANGYVGPGQNMAHDVFSIGSYGIWSFWWNLRGYHPLDFDYDPTLPIADFRSAIEENTDQWETWFQTNSPETSRFLYVEDEPFSGPFNGRTVDTFAFAETVAAFVAQNPGPGSTLDTFTTANPVIHGSTLASHTILGAQIDAAPTDAWELELSLNPQRKLIMYNGRRPASGTFMIDDEGSSLREIPWGQYKQGVDRWFYWNSTYYNNRAGGAPSRDLSEVGPDGGEDFRLGSRTNVFKSAHTFGGHSSFNPVIGEAGFNYANGDGVLFYPGTDLVFPDQSYGLNGPIASLRLKHWRRGIQDIQYVALAMAQDPIATQQLVNETVPLALWEIGVEDPNDPTFVHRPPSWSTDPDDWETTRRQLATIIANDGCPDDEIDDSDGDGICTGSTFNAPMVGASDNCTTFANSDQLDSDNDGFGNRCDADLNNDCFVDFIDFALFRFQFFTSGPTADFTGDGFVDFIDFALFRSLFFQPPGPGATECEI